MRPAPLLAAVLALAAVSAVAAPQGAQPSAQALDLARAVRDDRSEAKGVEAQIAHLKTQLVELAAVEAAGERGSGGKRARLDSLAAEESALSQRLGASQNATARLLGALALYRRDPPPALLVHPQSAKDAVRAQILARALAPELQRRSATLREQLTKLQLLRRQVESASADLFTSDSAVAEARGRLEQMIADRQVLQKSLLTDAEATERSLAALAHSSRSAADMIARLPAAGADTLGGGPERLVEPVQGRLAARYGQTFGKQAPEKGAPREGFTWIASPGAPVLAPASSVVEYAGPLKDYGVILILRTGGTYRLVLTGLGATDAVAGQQVAAGEPIGRMAEDQGPGPSLYLEVRRGGETVDPSRWFKTAAAR